MCIKTPRPLPSADGLSALKEKRLVSTQKHTANLLNPKLTTHVHIGIPIIIDGKRSYMDITLEIRSNK